MLKKVFACSRVLLIDINNDNHNVNISQINEKNVLLFWKKKIFYLNKNRKALSINDSHIMLRKVFACSGVQ